MIQQVVRLREQLEGEQDETRRAAIQAEIKEAQLKLDIALDKFKSPS